MLHKRGKVLKSFRNDPKSIGKKKLVDEILKKLQKEPELEEQLLLLETGVETSAFPGIPYLEATALSSFNEIPDILLFLSAFSFLTILNLWRTSSMFVNCTSGSSSQTFGEFSSAVSIPQSILNVSI
jgi:hypothetical protein